jgi:hypothetical protein
MGQAFHCNISPRMFEKFFRVPGTDSRGAGLGLAIARESLSLTGGRTGMNSQPGKGSEFYFILPAIERSAETKKTKGNKVMSGKILIVDDERNVRMMYRTALETEGYEVIGADSGVTALAEFKHGNSISPSSTAHAEMDGLELLETMRNQNIDHADTHHHGLWRLAECGQAMKLAQSISLPSR